MDPNLISDNDWVKYVGGSDGAFCLNLDGFNDLQNSGVDIDEAYAEICSLEGTSSKKRVRDESCMGPKSKACREKMRRDRLNDRFLELSSILDPGRPPKSDKGTILSDAVRMVVQLRSEAQQLKEANETLQETIEDLKIEKNELRDEKTKLKADKDRLEQQLKAMSVAPTGYMPHPASLHAAAAAAFAVQGQAVANKMATPYPGFPGVAMWQWMPPTVIDTSQDHKLRPPVA